jgi:hypothetical protein
MIAEEEVAIPPSISTRRCYMELYRHSTRVKGVARDLLSILVKDAPFDRRGVIVEE